MARRQKGRDARSRGFIDSLVDLFTSGKRSVGDVRSYSPGSNSGRYRQPRPLFVEEFYTLRRINYVVRACSDVIASDVALEGHLWERVEDEPETPGQKALLRYAEELLEHPNPQTSEHDLLEGLAIDLLIGADAYLEVVYDSIQDEKTGEEIDRRPSQFWNVDGSTMWIVPEDETGRLPPPPATAYQQQVRTETQGFTKDEIIHISDGNVAGRLYGTPRLLSAVLLIGTMQKALKYNYMTFRGQRYPKSVISVGQLLQDGDLDRIIEKMAQQAEENPNGIGVIDSPDLKLLKLIDSNRDMEFMDLMRFTERSICAVFRVPPVKIGISETGGAGIVVGFTQMQTYWDNVEGLQRQIAEDLNRFFRDVLGLRAWRLRLKSGRPELYNEQAVIEDLRIKNGSLTINEVRATHGLDPVEWGDEPPTAAAPAFNYDPQNESKEGDDLARSGMALSRYRPGLVFPSLQKDVAPGRMQNSPLVDPEAESVQDRTRSRLAGSWMRARERMLQVFDELLIVPGKSLQVVKQEQITSPDELADLLDQVLAEWEQEADAILAEGNADAYADGRTEIRESLEVQEQVPAFGKGDEESLQAIQDELAAQPIRSFRGEQRQLVELAVEEGFVEGDIDLYKVRGRIETQFREFTDKETWQLDRIVRTSVHQANSAARVRALHDSGVQEVRYITANDGRVRPSHARYHNEIIPLDLAERLLRDINCRCQIVKPARRPSTVPSPDTLAEAIRTEGTDARVAARSALEAR